MAAPPAKPQFHWKLLVAPVVLMGMSKAGLNYEQPAVRLSFRGAYVVSHILVAVLLWYLYQEIKKRADPKKPVKIKESSDDGTKPALYLTERQYDLSELQKHAQHFGIVRTLYCCVTNQPIRQISQSPKSPARDSPYQRSLRGCGRFPWIVSEAAPPRPKRPLGHEPVRAGQCRVKGGSTLGQGRHAMQLHQ